jgi:hypothetical protein
MGRTGLKITPKEPLIFFENVIWETKGFPQKKEEPHNTCSKFKPAIVLEYEIIHEAPKTWSQSSQIKILGEQSLNLGWYEIYMVFFSVGWVLDFANNY